jgi:transposase
MSTMADTKTKRTRRNFTEDYKAGAVRLVLDEGRTVAAAASDLGLTESSLRNWVEHARADRTNGKTGLTTAEREELARLRKELRIVQEEREILKKRFKGDGVSKEQVLDVQRGSRSPRSSEDRRKGVTK